MTNIGTIANTVRAIWRINPPIWPLLHVIITSGKIGDRGASHRNQYATIIRKVAVPSLEA